MSYFDLQPQQRHSSESSEPISPTTTSSRANALHARTRPKSRLSGSFRSKSDYESYTVPPMVNTIREESHTQPPPSPAHSSELLIENDNHSRGSLGRKIGLLQSDPPKPSEILSTLRKSTGVVPTPSASLSKEPIPEARAFHSISLRRVNLSKRSLSDQSHHNHNPSSSSLGDQSTKDVSNQLQVGNRIEPLRPPIRPPLTIRSPPSESSVRVETPFTHPNEQHRLTQHDQSDNGANTQKEPIARKISIDPLLLFSSPFLVIRDFARSRHSRKSVTQVRTDDRDSAEVGSGLSRQQSRKLLARVASLLQDVKSLGASGRSGSNLSKSTEHSKACLSSGQDASRHKAVLKSDKSTEMGTERESDSSSLKRFKMGALPSNTPEEQATYTIKRSPSAKTERFLKIDISIRGGTSYLPSEATRIYTPPALKKGADGRQRGFFFDCIPNTQQDHRCSKLANSHNLKSEDTDQMLTKQDSSPSLMVKQYRKARAGGWYSAQLAQLDVQDVRMELVDNDGSGEELICIHSHSSMTSEDKWAQDDESQLDHNIPEHLPSSPLCPRNPRYWRVKRNKGSQFRGC